MSWTILIADRGSDGLWQRFLHRITTLILATGTLYSVVGSVKAAYSSENDRVPNIVLIMADDVGYECFGCYGSKQYSTPHIDRIAEDGIRFSHCYSQPLCTPSRVKLMTGLTNARNYSAFSVLNRDQRTIGQYFKQAGYKTFVGGKWQLLGAEHYAERFRGKGTLPQDAGFDRYCLWQVDKLGERYWGPLLNIDGENRQFGKDEYGPEIVTDHICDFIDDNQKEPFFVYYPMILVHNPFPPTPDSESRESKDNQKNFEDMVAFMDKMVGRIVVKVEELGLAENTLIMFTGDNGTNTSLKSMLNGRIIRGGKGSMTDAGTHVAFVASWKGTIPAGRICDDIIDFSDVLPTCLETIGADIPENLDGRSFLPQLLGEKGNPRDWIYIYYCPRPERTKPTRFARDQRYKLYGDGRFFEVASDVDEKHPLKEIAADTPAAVAQKKLQAALNSMPAEGQSLLKFATSD